MILLDDNEVKLSHFPDGTFSFRQEPSWNPNHIYRIGWKYEDAIGGEECMALWYLVHHLREASPHAVIDLYMPYIPNARMDRVKKSDEVFFLKWFAAFLNTMNLNKVIVLDAHSDISLALIDRVQSLDASQYVVEVFAEIGDDEILFCYPDEGAAKRNANLYKRDYVFGIKHRDWRTGNIESLEIIGADKVKGKNVLIIDDICSRGGTFTHTAKALKKAGAEKIYLYVSHCENTIFDGTVLTDGLIDHVYTTDSIFRGDHEKITVL